jgi:hypothetical protein
MNTLNKQLWTDDKGWSSSLGVGRGANKPSPQKINLLQNINVSLGFITIRGRDYGKLRHKAYVAVKMKNTAF